MPGADGATRRDARQPLAVRAAVGAAMTVGALVAVVGSAMTWVTSGGAARHSYDLLRLVERLGFAPDGPATVALRWWPVMPLLAVAAVVAMWTGRPRPGGVLGLVAGGYAGTVGVAVLRAPAAGLLAVGAGPAVTTAGAVVLFGASLAAAAGAASTPRRAVTAPPTAPAAPARPAGPPAGRS